MRFPVVAMVFRGNGLVNLTMLKGLRFENYCSLPDIFKGVSLNTIFSFDFPAFMLGFLKSLIKDITRKVIAVDCDVFIFMFVKNYI